MKRFTILFAAVVLSFVSVAWADVPKLINFQSLLTTSAGDTVANGNYTITFRIYNVSSGGSPLWTESQTVATSGGLFSVLLGAFTPLPTSVLDGTIRYLSIQVAPDPEMPSRTRLVSVPYAYFALRTDTANLALNVPGGPFLPLSGGTMTGPITNTGNPFIKMGKGNFGSGNTNSGTNAFVSGEGNAASGSWSTISGGLYDTASNFYTTISGGSYNIAYGQAATIGGGKYNKARGTSSVVAGGGDDPSDSNAALGDYSVVGGGVRNIASGLRSVVSGGSSNKASGQGATVGGGSGNVASGGQPLETGSTVGGGWINTASGNGSTIAGGSQNTASGNSSTIAGGYINTANGAGSTIGGGDNNTANGSSSVIPGGSVNSTLGNCSFAAGFHANANHDGSFVWADFLNPPVGVPFNSTGANQFLIRAAGGVGIGTNSPSEKLEVNGNAKITGTLFASNVSSNSPLRLQTAGTTRMYIDDVTGKVGIGTTSPSKLLTIQADAADFDLLSSGTGGFDISTQATNGGAITISSRQGSSAGIVIDPLNLVGIGTTTPAAKLHVNGSAGNNTGVWSNLSDRRLKKDIQPIQEALKTVGKLQGVTFHWDDSKKDAEYGRIRGLIAQDVEKVIPEWVKTDPDGYKRLEPIGIDALLIEAIKEQQKTIEELKDRIEKLEKKNRQASKEIVGRR